MLLDKLRLRHNSDSRNRRVSDRASRPFRLRVESLEDRAAPATFTVNTTLDEVVASDGKLSLREAITRANTTTGADEIIVPVRTLAG
jgi:CSLREA domain-containing protein